MQSTTTNIKFDDLCVTHSCIVAHLRNNHLQVLMIQTWMMMRMNMLTFRSYLWSWFSCYGNMYILPLSHLFDFHHEVFNEDLEWFIIVITNGQTFSVLFWIQRFMSNHCITSFEAFGLWIVHKSYGVLKEPYIIPPHCH